MVELHHCNSYIFINKWGWFLLCFKTKFAYTWHENAFIGFTLLFCSLSLCYLKVATRLEYTRNYSCHKLLLCNKMPNTLGTILVINYFPRKYPWNSKVGGGGVGDVLVLKITWQRMQQCNQNSIRMVSFKERSFKVLKLPFLACISLLFHMETRFH